MIILFVEEYRSLLARYYTAFSPEKLNEEKYFQNV
jgi:hypothetical protein